MEGGGTSSQGQKEMDRFDKRPDTPVRIELGHKKRRRHGGLTKIQIHKAYFIVNVPHMLAAENIKCCPFKTIVIEL